MKYLKIIVPVVLLVVVIVLAVIYFNLNSIVRSTVETQATNNLKVQTTLGAANISLFGGKVAMDDLKIGSPKGFNAPHLFTLDDVAVAVDYGQLNNDPIRVSSIAINQPRLVIEQSGGKVNVQALMEQMTPDDSGKPQPTPEPQKEEGEPVHLIIDDLKLLNAVVVLRPGLPGLKDEITVNVPSLEMKNVGTGEGNQNGAAIQEVIMEIITALTAKASESGNIPPELKQLLNVNVDQMIQQGLGKAGEELQKQLPGDVGKSVEGVLKNPDLQKDPGKAIQEGLGGFLNQKKQDQPSTQPAK